MFENKETNSKTATITTVILIILAVGMIVGLLGALFLNFAMIGIGIFCMITVLMLSCMYSNKKNE
ncbi:MAG: hypothetical protein WC389_20520 [Lutibacter sp.]|jgi:1,4-dihydroxy-2-naphthoate octaprenyltransferase